MIQQIVIISLLLSGYISVQAQGNFHWPDDTAKAQENWVLFTDAVKSQRYQDALEPFLWLLENAPDLHSALYINGEKLYKGLIAAAEPALQKKYQEQLLTLYDLRMQYFHEEATVINRKIFAAYQFYRNRKEKYPELLKIFENAFQSFYQDFSSGNLVAYMDVIRVAQAEEKALSDEEVLNRYNLIIQALQSQNSTEDIGKKQATIDNLLASTVQLNCALIEEKFGKPFLEQSEDIAKAKRIVALGLAYQCKDLPVFLKAAQLVQQHEPTYGLAKMLALMYDAQQAYQAAETSYLEAVKFARENTQKGETLYALATHYQRRDLKDKARDAALQALKADPSRKEAYRLVGDLYFYSFEACKEGESATLDRTVYIAAYHLYQKAGRADLMKQARQQFPSREEIFQDGYKEGQPIRIGCWINEQVILQSRNDVQ